MHLDIAYPVDTLYVLPHQLCHVAGAHCIERQTHGKQAVRIFSERLAVEEVSPAPKHLTVQDRHGYRIQYLERRQVLHSRHDKDCDHRCDHAAVYGEPSLPEIKDIKQIILVHIPGEYHIEDPCAGDP